MAEEEPYDVQIPPSRGLRGETQGPSSVGDRVVVRRSDIEDGRGTLIEDYALFLELLDEHEGRPQVRHWAVALDTGHLVFVDDDDIEPEIDTAPVSVDHAASITPTAHLTGGRPDAPAPPGSPALSPRPRRR